LTNNSLVPSSVEQIFSSKVDNRLNLSTFQIYSSNLQPVPILFVSILLRADFFIFDYWYFTSNATLGRLSRPLSHLNLGCLFNFSKVALQSPYWHGYIAVLCLIAWFDLLISNNNQRKFEIDCPLSIEFYIDCTFFEKKIYISTLKAYQILANFWHELFFVLYMFNILPLTY